MRLNTRRSVMRHLCCFLAYVLFFEPMALALAQTPALQTPRVGHTTSILGDGTAVLSGGRAQPATLPAGKPGGAPTDSAERYDGATGMVTPVPGPMTSPRAGHSAASTPTGEVLLGGGEDNRGRLATLENYLPGLGQFVPSALALPGPLSHFTATTLSEGRILVAAGYNGSSLVSVLAYLLNPRSQAVVPSRSQLATPRAKHMAALMPDGRVAILAGDTGSGPTGSIEVYDGVQDAFSVSPVALAVPRSEAAVALLPSGQLLVTGGRGADGTVRADSELVDLVRGTAVPGPALPGPRAGHTLNLLPDSRLLLAGGTDGQGALKNLDALPPLALDATAPSVVHVSPPDNAQDISLDAIVALRFSEPMRVTTVTTANVVLTGPSGRVEGTVATAESGLLAFFSPSLLEADTSYILALAGITDTSGNPLPAFSSRFRTGKSAGEAPRVASFSPTAGAPGDEITLRGERFTGATGVAFGGIAAASFTLVNDTTLKAVVPAGAVTGPLSVTTPAGTGTSTGYFVVLSKPDFKIAVAPDRGEVLQGDQYAFAVNVVPSGGFLGMVKLSVSGLPAQLAASFDKAQLGPVGYAYLTVAADLRVPQGQYRFTVTGASDIGGKQVQRTVDATLQVSLPAGTSLSGRVVRLDGVPVPNYLVRVGNQQTRADAAGNFLLRHLQLPKAKAKKEKDDDLVLVLDGRPAALPGIDYPIYEQLLEYAELKPNQPNKLNYGHPIWIFALDPRTAIQVDATRQRTYTFPHLPGFEITVPAGTTLTDIDGRRTTTINVAQIPLDRPHLHDTPKGADPSALYSIQFGGTTASKPIQVTMPNVGNLSPGTRVRFYFYDVAKYGWFSPGMGTVTQDGRQIKPDPGVGVTRLHCLFPVWDPQGDADAPGSDTGGEPVSLSTGLFTLEKTDLVLPGRFPIVFTRAYRSKRTRQGPFGIGTSHSFDVFAGQPTGQTYFQLILPSDYRLNFFPADGYVHKTTPVFYGARAIGGDPNPLFITLKDGTKWGFGKKGGYPTSLEDRHGNKLTIERPDALSPATRILAPDDIRVVAFEYDGSNRITKIVGPLEQTVRYTYSPAGDLETVTDPVGGVTRYTYDPNHNLLTITDPRGIPYLTNEYDANQRVFRQTLATTGAGTATWQFAYTLSGSTVTQTVVTDPRGKTKTYAFNPAGYTTSITNALQQTTTINRESPSNLVTDIQDHLQRKTVFGYDTCCKNLTSITRYKDPIANPPTYTQPVTWSFTYDTAAGHFNLLTSVTTPPSPVARTWTYILDLAGKTVTTIRDPLSHDTYIFYNSFGQPTEIRDALTHSTFLGYDPTLALLSTVTDHLGNTTTYTYDFLGRRVAVTDPRGATTRFTYDFLNRLVQVADPLGRPVRFEYDPNSNLTKVIDPRGGEITYDYDNMDQLVTRKDPLLRQETFGYDLAGNLTSFQDRKNQVTTWSPYDDLNRPTTVTFQGGATLTYGYDAANRLQTLTDSIAGGITWVYDVLDRVTRETTLQGTVTYGLDDADRRTSMLVAGQPQVDYQWDNANRLTDITRGILAAHYEYDAANRRTSLQLPNPVSITYGYDDANRLTSLTYSGLIGGNQNLTYAYDPAGNRTVMGGSWARTLLPAAITTASYDAANRQLTLGGKAMTYDDNGNLATLTENRQTTTYTWDVRDRLTSISGPITASFGYDAFHRRTQKTVAGFSTTFQYDGLDVVREVAGGAELNYLRGLDIDEPLARIEASATSYYLADALGSILALVDVNGNVTTSYAYGPFGDSFVTGSPSPNAFLFTARENDGTGLYCYRARYYGPSLFRFIAEDPLGPPMNDANAYSYVGNNPLALIDPLGMEKAKRQCTFSGLASWYNLPGKTASQKPFDPNKMTGAMTPEKVDLGTTVTVEYSYTDENGITRTRTVSVEINDRGPWQRGKGGKARRPLQPHPKRIIDLTPRAFDELVGSRRPGVVPVTVRIPQCP